jgi:hypothetical protein
MKLEEGNDDAVPHAMFASHDRIMLRRRKTTGLCKKFPKLPRKEGLSVMGAKVPAIGVGSSIRS